MKKKFFNTKSEKDNRKPENKKFPDLIIVSDFLNKWKLVLLISFLSLSLIIPALFILTLYGKFSIFGFPLDDPWIHLQFAKNLIDFGTFSFYKDQVITSGSTSPIYTILLSVLYFAFNNEFFISYLLGIGFAICSVCIFYLLSKKEFEKYPLIIYLITGIFVFQPSINLISVSGMETTMFIFFILLSFYFYKNMNKVLLGLFLGLTIWCRPDGVVLWIAIFFDLLFKALSKPEPPKKETKKEDRRSRFEDIPLVDDKPDHSKKKTTEKPNSLFILKYLNKEILTAFGIGTVIVLFYFIFNFILSGSFLPNTYSAKIEYYQLNQRGYFLTNELLPFFGAYDLIILFFFFIIGTVFILSDIKNRKYNPYFIYAVFVFGFILIYFIKLPFLHRFGRYMMPVIPAFYFVAISGFIALMKFISEKVKNRLNPILNKTLILFFCSLLILSVIKLVYNINDFADLSKYHNDRHVAAGKWINKNTDTKAIIATHDIGAIGFYGNRKVIDLVGLVTPDLIKYLNDKDYSNIITNYMDKYKVNYVAVLKNWFEIVNDNPVYVASPEPEILEIYKYQNGKTHFQSREVSLLNDQAILSLQQNNPAQAINFLQRSLLLDKKSSKTYFLLGAASEVNNQLNESITYYKMALGIYQNYAEAYFGLAKTYFTQKNYPDARTSIIRCLNIKPDFQPALELLRNLPKK